MKTQKKAFLLLVISVIVTGCVQSPMSTPGYPMTETPFISPTPTIRSIESPVSDETLVAASPVSINTLKSQCLNIESNDSAKVESQGTLVLSGTEDLEGGLVRYTAYKMNMRTMESVELSDSNETIFDVAVSPDRKSFAYSEGFKNLVITDANGKNLQTIPWEKTWGIIASWLDNQRLLIGIDVSSDDTASPAQKSSTFLVLNPFTGTRQMVYPDYPGIYDYPLLMPWTNFGETSYNPSLDRVVYLKRDPQNVGIFHYALWDIAQRQGLADFEVTDANPIPRWSPDGTRFVFAPGLRLENPKEKWPAYELYIVSKNGKSIQLTDLASYYLWTYIDNMSWSPDGKQIAFWFSGWSSEKPDWDLVGDRLLAIVDTETKVITNYCIPGFIGPNSRVLPPVWSPDGKQLIVVSPTSDTQSRVILVDLTRMIVFQLAENMEPIGWMLEEP